MFSITKKKRIAWGHFTELDDFPIIHAVSFRTGGVSSGQFAELNMGYNTDDEPANIWMNRKLFADTIGIIPENIITLRQVHGSKVICVSKSDLGKGAASWDESADDADAMITNEVLVPMAILTADCTSVFFYDREHGVSGIAHAGWRSTAANINKNVLSLMNERFGSKPQNVWCGIGPSIGAERFEVNKDVASHFNPQTVIRKNGKTFINLELANKLQLKDAGIPESQIGISSMCTYKNVGLCYSHRRDNGSTGRMMSVIMSM